MKIKQLVRRINSLQIRQTERWDDFRFPKEIDEILSKAPLVSVGEDIEKYKSYETSRFVYKIGKKYLGLRLVANRLGKSAFDSDINWIIDAIEMKPFKITNYIYKSNHR